MAETITESSLLEITSCCVCGIRFAVPESRMAHSRNKQADLFCPNGHSLTWKETDAQRLQKQLAKRQAEFEQANRLLNDERRIRSVVEKSLESERKKTTRMKRRISAGVCPCCNRSFGNLCRHMKTEHPEFQKDKS